MLNNPWEEKGVVHIQAQVWHYVDQKDQQTDNGRNHYSRELWNFQKSKANICLILMEDSRYQKG